MYHKEPTATNHCLMGGYEDELFVLVFVADDVGKNGLRKTCFFAVDMFGREIEEPLQNTALNRASAFDEAKSWINAGKLTYQPRIINQ